MWIKYLKIAWRNLFRNRTNSLINLSGLTIGMTAAFFIFIWVSNEYSYDRHHPEAEQIYRLTSYSKKSETKSESTPYSWGEAIQTQLAEVELVTHIRPVLGFVPTARLERQFFKEEKAAHVDGNWFKMFHFDFVDGNAANFNNVANTVIIAESKAMKYFGQSNVVGYTLRLDDTDYTVQGVIEDSPTNSSFHYDLYLPVLARHSNDFWERWDLNPINNAYRTYVKLATTTSPERSTENISRLAHEAWNAEYELSLLSLGDIHFEEGLWSSDIEHGEKRMTQILFLLGVILLVVACVNYVNLTTAGATLRIKEVSVKKIVGAPREQLFVQFVVESALMAVLALLTTLLLVLICLPWFNNFVDNHFVLDLGSPMLWSVTIGTLLVTVLLTSIYPAVLLSGFKPAAALRGKSLSRIGDNTLRKGLVVLQFSVSVMLIVATVVIYSQMAFINAQNKRFDRSTVFSFVLPQRGDDHQRLSRMESIKQELLNTSSIAEVARGDMLVNLFNPWSGFDWDGYNPEATYHITFMVVDADLDQLLNLRMKDGRWFQPNNISDRSNFVLNETAVRELGISEPTIGQRFVHDADTGVVVGVVEDFHYANLREQIGSVVFSNNLNNVNSLVVKTAAGKQQEALRVTEQIYSQFAPEEPFDYHFASEEFESLYRKDFKVASLIGFFSMLAIFVSCMGLYGLAIFSAASRHKEIGIRKVHGASVTSIAKMLSKDFVKLVSVAIVFSSPVAYWAMDRWLENFVYHIDIAWWMFAVAGLVAISIAVFTVGWKALWAANLNPVKSLKSE